jgi:hypothetical protein
MSTQPADADRQKALLERAEMARVSGSFPRKAMRTTDVDKWFSSLSQTGEASLWDWTQQATRLDAARRFAEAGESWQKAAEWAAVPARSSVAASMRGLLGGVL